MEGFLMERLMKSDNNPIFVLADIGPISSMRFGSGRPYIVVKVLTVADDSHPLGISTSLL